MRASVLVLDLFPQTLAVVRSLGKAGYRVILGRGTGERKPPAQWSRHCSEVWLHPSYEDVEKFQQALTGFLHRRTDVRVIFPIAEPAIRALGAIPSLGDRPIHLVMVPEPLFSACVDKLAGNRLASRAGIRAPESAVASNPQCLRKAARGIGFPVVLKALRSEGRVLGRKAFLVGSEEILETAFETWPAEHAELLVQEYIPGPLVSVDFVASGGVLVAYLEARIPRTDMPDGTGGGIEFESIPPTPDVLAAVASFVASNDYSGPGVIQFIRHADTRDLYFVENNPRLAAGVAHPIGCGADLPLVSLRATEKGGPRPAEFDPRSAPYRYNYFVYWMERDLVNWISGRPEFRGMEIQDWLRLIRKSYLQTDGHIYWDPRDPLPSVLVWARILERLCRRLGTEYVTRVARAFKSAR